MDATLELQAQMRWILEKIKKEQILQGSQTDLDILSEKNFFGISAGPGETAPTLNEQEYLLRILEKKNILSIEEMEVTPTAMRKAVYGEDYFGDYGYHLKIDQKRFDEFYKKRISKISEVDEKTNGLNEHLIRRDTEGYFFYNGYPIALSKTNIAYDLFEIIYSQTPKGGLLSYRKIGVELRKRKRGDGSPKSIQKALGDHQGFLKIAKVRGKTINRKNPDGKDLIEIIRGKGLQFNNPSI